MKRLIFIFLWLSICVSCLYQIRAENHVHQSSVILWAGVPENLEGYEGYTYNISDLKMRYRIMNGNSNALKQSVKNFENEGWAEPLTGKNYWNTYGATLGKLRVFAQVFEAVSMGVSAGSGVNASRALAGRVHVNRVSAKTLNTIKAGIKDGYNISDDAAELIKMNKGRNSVTMETATQRIRYDLAGKTQGKVPTPHMQVYNKNFVNGELKSITRASKHALPMTKKDMDIVRKFLNEQ